MLGQIKDIEKQLLEASKQTRQLALRRYVENLKHMLHKECQPQDLGSEDCVICLNDFDPEDEIVIYSCDTKHYFHKKCGAEWLDVRPECPLCR